MATCCDVRLYFYVSVSNPFCPGRSTWGRSAALHQLQPQPHISLVPSLLASCRGCSRPPPTDAREEEPESGGRDEAAPAALGPDHGAGGGVRRVAHLCPSRGPLFVRRPVPSSAPCWQFTPGGLGCSGWQWRRKKMKVLRDEVVFEVA